jgi:hypothetical protein
MPSWPIGVADGEVDEQAGEPAARGDPDRGHRDEQDERADEQELVEVVNSQRPFLPDRRDTTSWLEKTQLVRYLT